MIEIVLNIVVGAEGDPKNLMICSFGNADHNDCCRESMMVRIFVVFDEDDVDVDDTVNGNTS